MTTTLKISVKVRGWLRMLENLHNRAGAPTYLYRIDAKAAYFTEAPDLNCLAAALNNMGFGKVAEVVFGAWDTPRIKIVDPVNQALVAEGILAE